MTVGLISFSSFASTSDRGAYGWRRSSAAVREHAGTDTAVDDTARSYWRLHASNNRELARSVRLYPSQPEARRHAASIAHALDRLQVSTFVVGSARSKGWYATIDGEPVMMCARWYQSTAVAGQAAGRSVALFTSLVPTAPPHAVESV